MESDLPFEVLCEILSYLDVPHRLIASLVCRRWLLACSTQMGDVWLNLDSRRLKLGTSYPSLPLTRSFCNVALEKTNIDGRCSDFLNYLSPQILHLWVMDSSIMCIPWAIDCPQLLTLETDSADILTAVEPPLTRLESLDLFDARDVSDETLGSLDAIAPNLREFNMPRTVAFDRRVTRRFYPTSSLPPSPLVLTTGAVEKFIAKRAATLTSLRLPPDTPADVALRIASTPGLTLTNVDMSYCRGLDGRLGEFFKLQPRVAVLNVWGMRMEYEELETVARLLPCLRVFKTSCGFQEQALALVFRLRHLRRLCVHCYTIPPGVFSTFASVDLRFLDLGYRIDNESVQELLTRAPALRELKMGFHRMTFFRDGSNIRTIRYWEP